jgi:hypothetical protein
MWSTVEFGPFLKVDMLVILGVLVLVLVAVALLVAFVAVTWEHDIVQRWVSLLLLAPAATAGSCSL